MEEKENEERIERKESGREGIRRRGGKKGGLFYGNGSKEDSGGRSGDGEREK